MNSSLFLTFLMLFTIGCSTKSEQNYSEATSYSDLNVLISYHKQINRFSKGSHGQKAACFLAKHEIRWFLTSAGTGNHLVPLFDSAKIVCDQSGTKGVSISHSCIKKYFIHLNDLIEKCKKVSPK